MIKKDEMAAMAAWFNNASDDEKQAMKAQVSQFMMDTFGALSTPVRIGQTDGSPEKVQIMPQYWKPMTDEEAREYQVELMEAFGDALGDHDNPRPIIAEGYKVDVREWLDGFKMCEARPTVVVLKGKAAMFEVDFAKIEGDYYMSNSGSGCGFHSDVYFARSADEVSVARGFGSGRVALIDWRHED